MLTSAAATVEEARVRGHMDTLAQALRAKDVGALMAHYAPDMVTFDLRPPARIVTADAYRRNFEAWFASVRGPIGYRIHDLGIELGGDTAFCHYRAHVTSTRTTSDTSDYWVRVTSGLRNTAGGWLIAHEHISMPIDLVTMRAVPGK
jgi:ketosteroid isomerase-like protein